MPGTRRGGHSLREGGTDLDVEGWGHGGWRVRSGRGSGKGGECGRGSELPGKELLVRPGRGAGRS